MPYIEVKATENRLADPAVRERLIAELTDAACRVFGEDLRPNIWVVVEAVPGQQWGVGGKPLSLHHQQLGGLGHLTPTPHDQTSEQAAGEQASPRPPRPPGR
jgi:phenylpyruvate tautomerase PptA (4-oxalocrotonate tautomerase family)